MRRVWIKALAGAGLASLVLVMTAAGQQPSGGDQKAPPPREKEPPTVPGSTTGKQGTKSKLEELLAQALQNNPDIRVAAAKASEAEAELQRTRLEVLQKVVKAHHAVEVAEANVARCQTECSRLQREVKRATVDPSVLTETENQLAVAKAQLAAAQAELPYLVGKAPAESRTIRAAMDFLQEQHRLREYEGTLSAAADLRLGEAVSSGSKSAPGAMADKIRKALERPVTITASQEPLKRVLDDLRTAAGVPIQAQADSALDVPVTVKLESVPLGAALQWVEDVVPGYQVAVRDYGLLLAKKESLPRGALLLNEFWKSGAGGAARADKNPPPENVEGVVKSVDPSGVVKLNIGSDAGLSKGHTLDVFRLSPTPEQSKYLGRIRLLEVTPTEAVGQPVGKMSNPPQPGDRVASKILGQ